MTIYEAINGLKIITPASEASARAFLDTLPLKVQDQLISAIYIGRDHINAKTLHPGDEISRSSTDHIDRSAYASIVSNKGNDAITYLDKLVACAKTSGFDLNDL